MKEDRYKLGVVFVSFRQHSPKEIFEATKAAEISCKAEALRTIIEEYV